MALLAQLLMQRKKHLHRDCLPSIVGAVGGWCYLFLPFRMVDSWSSPWVGCRFRNISLRVSQIKSNQLAVFYAVACSFFKREVNENGRKKGMRGKRKTVISPLPSRLRFVTSWKQKQGIRYSGVSKLLLLSCSGRKAFSILSLGMLVTHMGFPNLMFCVPDLRKTAPTW